MRRQNNEDSHIERLAGSEDEFRRHGHLFVVADGMGGHAVGEMASKLAIETVSHLTFLKDGPRQDILRESLVTANETIHSKGKHNRDFERMGTTCTALSLSPAGAIVGHVGDSRVYRIRRDRIDQLSFDHSVDWEIRRRHPGRVPDELLKAHKNVITRSLGPEPKTQVDIEGPIPVLPGDRFLLCSDGLTGLVEDEEIGTIARVLPPKEAVRLLVDLANLRGGNDNCTVSLIDVGELPHGVPLPEYVDERPVWTLPPAWIIGWVLTAIILCLAAVSYVAGRVYIATVLLLLGAGAAGFVIVGTMRHREAAMKLGGVEDNSRTLHTRPHATSIAMPLPDLLDELQSASDELLSAAREDSWPLNWEAVDQAAAKAREAIDGRKYAAALREQGRCINQLMRALHKLRVKANAT